MTPGVGSTPYGGTAVALPGTVQVENFDDGGQSAALARLRTLTPALIVAEATGGYFYTLDFSRAHSFTARVESSRIFP